MEYPGNLYNNDYKPWRANYHDSITIGSPLPIELLSFSAHAVDNGVSWSGSQLPKPTTLFLQLRKSYNGKEFEEVIKVKNGKLYANSIL